MVEWLFAIAGWGLLLGGVFIAWWWGWRDPRRKTRRCPKCWYDMSATVGLRCPECGREVGAQRKLFRRRLAGRWVATGLLLVLASYPAFRWPLCQTVGPIGLVPRVVTLAFCPEITNVVNRWFPKYKRTAFLLLDDLYKARPFDRPERYALAWMYGRALTDIERFDQVVGPMSFRVARVGNQAGVMAKGLAAALRDPRLRAAAIGCVRFVPLVDDARMNVLPGPLGDAIAASPTGLSQSEALLERMQAWGANQDQLRAAAFHFIEHPAQQADGRAMEFLWREGLTRAADRDRLIGYLNVRVWPFVEYASYCVAELGTQADCILPQLKDGLGEDDLQSLPERTCLALAFGDRAKTLLPELDRYAEAARYPSFGACGAIAGLAIRGKPLDAYKLWNDKIAISDNMSAATRPQRYQLTPLVMFLDIPDEDKAVGLRVVLHLERVSTTPTSASGNLLFAINCIGKLRASGRPALEALLGLIDLDAPFFVVERALESLGKIGPLPSKVMSEVNRRMEAWKPFRGERGGADFWWGRLRAEAK